MNKKQSDVRKIALVFLGKDKTEVDEKIIFDKIQAAITALEYSLNEEEFNEV